MAESDGNKLRVLVVDDDRDLAQAFQTLLETEGFEVHLEHNGKTALAYFKEHYADVAFVDGLLPGLDGFSLCGEMRWVKHGERMPLIMISGVYRASTHARDAMAKYRLIEYLEKPIAPSRVIEVLRQVFGTAYPRPLPVAPVVQAAAETESVTKKANPRLVNTFFLYDASKLPLVGKLDEVPFPLLLAEAWRRRLTGHLLVSDDKVKKVIGFDKGRPASISSNIAAECLGQRLFQQGRITKEALGVSLHVMQKEKRLQGEVLLQMGVITPYDLQMALTEQFAAKLYAVFAWGGMRYSFTPRADGVRTLNPPEIHPYALIREGLWSHTPKERLLAWLKPYRRSLLNHQDDLEARLSEAGYSLKIIRRIATGNAGDPVETLLRNTTLGVQEAAAVMVGTVIVGATRLSVPLPEEGEQPVRPDDIFLGIGEGTLLQAHVRYHQEQAKQAIEGGEAEAGVVQENVTRSNEEGRDKAEMLEFMQVSPRLAGEDQALYKRLFDKRRELRGKDFFARLGLEKGATAEAAKKAFREIAKTYHPDAVASADKPDLRKLADEVFTLFSKASEALTDPEQRKKLLDELGNTIPPEQDATADVARILAAEQQFHEAQKAVRRGDWAQAKQMLLEALRLHAEDGAFHTELGWVIFNLSPNDMVTRQEALKEIQHGLDLQPKNADAHFYFGSIYKATGEIVKAAEHYLEALKIDPKHVRARSEVRLMKMRKEENDKDKGGFLGGLFKRGK